MTLPELFAILDREPAIESFLVQHTIARDHEPYQKNDGGGHRNKDVKRDVYRVFLRTGKMVDASDPMRGFVHCDATGPDVEKAACAAFAAINVPLPFGLRK